MAKQATAVLVENNVSRDWLAQSIARGAKEPFAEIMDITPELAAAMLAGNSGNRPISGSNRQTLMRDIDAGRWQFNGESIVFAKSGELNDGQHRLAAALATGQTIRSVVVFGVDRESRLTLDTGRHRNTSEMLHFHGILNASTVGAVTRMVIAYERVKGANLYETKHVTVSEQVERALADRKLEEAARTALYGYQYARDFISGSQLGFLYYILGRVDPLAADSYLTQVSLGENLKRTDPAFIVRNRLQHLETRSREPRIAMVMRGWNYFRTGEKSLPQQITGDMPLPDLEP